MGRIDLDDFHDVHRDRLRVQAADFRADVTRAWNVNLADANFQAGLAGGLAGAGSQSQRVAADGSQLRQILLQGHPLLAGTGQHVAVQLSRANHPATLILSQVTIDLEAVRAAIEYVHVFDARGRRPDVVDHLVPEL